MSNQNLRFIVTSTHPEGDPDPAYIQRQLDSYLDDDWSDDSTIINEDGTFAILSPAFVDPICGQTYTRYYVVDGQNVGAELPENLQQEIQGLAPSSFETMFETESNTIREIWES